LPIHALVTFLISPLGTALTLGALGVMLGGGIEPARRGRSALPDLRNAADRVWHAARLYHAGKAPLLVLSGGSDTGTYATSEAMAMQQLLLQMGVPEAAMLLEEASRNTQQNAQGSGRAFKESVEHRV